MTSHRWTPLGGWAIALFALFFVSLSLAACVPTLRHSLPSDAVPESAALTPSGSGAPCQAELPPELDGTLNGYRLAQPEDFIATLRDWENQAKDGEFTVRYGDQPITCSVIAADFNGDRHLDYALIVVNEQRQTSQFRLVLTRGDRPEIVATRDFPTPPQTDEGLVYTAMFLKLPHQLGPAYRDSFPLAEGSSGRSHFISVAAVELWTAPIISPMQPPAALTSEMFRPDTLGERSEVFYLDRGELQVLQVSG
ncbi:MAG: hypothetical protein KME20_20535 [Kaiparowitsia implicata GSE-PSE-MK54-09C]|jgi:hypothetical protein|nr:hypothetical protein [Kaiparowitsia implicata GSE-PSE-MK54-09C]